MNQYLYDVSIWLKLNKLTLNVKKTVYMMFGNYCDSVPQNLDIKINNENIEKVNKCKYLGIIFDYNLKWHEHISYVIQRLKYLIYVFYKISKFMQIGTLQKIYYAFFHSILNYGIIAWGGAYINNLHLIQNLQNRILKIVYKNTFPQKKPLNIKQMFVYESLQYYYKHLKELFEKSTSRTRNKAIMLPKQYKAVSNKNNYIKSIANFNILPNDLKILDIDKKINKIKIKEWISKNII